MSYYPPPTTEELLTDWLEGPKPKQAMYEPWPELKDITPFWLHRVHMAHLLNDEGWYIREWYQKKYGFVPDKITFAAMNGWIVVCSSKDLYTKSPEQLKDEYYASSIYIDS